MKYNKQFKKYIKKFVSQNSVMKKNCLDSLISVIYMRKCFKTDPKVFRPYTAWP